MSVSHKIITCLLAVVAIISLSTAARAATNCQPPLAPTIPDGKTAPKADIIAALKTVKNDFQPAIVNFQNCIATEKAAIGDVATERQLLEWDQLFDYAYALETQVATKMNETIRAYKARATKNDDAPAPKE